jgi:6-phosphogluconolactonase (cycloisomerase 2 family)
MPASDYEEEPSLPGRHENQLQGEPRVEQRRAARHRVGLLGVAALVVSTALAAFAAGAGAASATASRVVGQVYVNDNTAVANTVAAFDRHADGSLTPISGSPFPTGGAGTGTILPSQGALQISDDGKYLLAVDAGSNEISVLRISHDGVLRKIHGGTVPSGGLEPVSIAVHGRLVYVANAGDGGSNYTGFTLSSDGRLRPLAASTVPLPDGSAPGDVVFNSTGTNVLGVRVNTSLIDSFAVGRYGRLEAAPGSPFAAQGAGPFGSEFRPTNPSQVFVSNAHNGGDNGTVSAFHVATDGSLSTVAGSPFADLQTAPCWVEISHDGQVLFAVNTGSDSISRYAIASDGSLTLLGNTPLGGGVSTPFDARLAPDGATLWVLDTGSATVSGFAVSGGSLAELPSSPTSLPAGATAFGIVVTD